MLVVTLGRIKSVCWLLGALLTVLVPGVHATEVADFVKHGSGHVWIKDVRLIDGTGADARVGQDVVVRDGGIVWIGAHGTATDRDVFGTAQPRTDALERLEIVQASGMSLLPGYVMMHEHLMYTANSANFFFVANQPISFPRLYLAAGVTTARTAGGVNVSQDLNIAHEIRQSRLVGPDFDVTSPHMVGGLPKGADFPYGTIGLPDLRNTEGAIRFVEYWAGLGVTSFKSHTHVAGSILKAGIRAAHNKGMKFTGHLCSVTYAQAARMGIDNIEHGFFEMTDFVADKVDDVCPDGRGDFNNLDPDQAEVSALIDLLIKEQVAVTSTLPVFVRGHKTLGELSVDALALLDAPTRAAFLQRRSRALVQAETWHEQLDQRIRVAMSLMKSFHDKGGHLMVGTDPTGMGGTIAGIANFEAIELLVEAGLTPLQAIKVATLNGAQYLEREHRIGTVSVGKQADLVLVHGAPDQDISDVRNVSLVFKQGVGFDAPRLFDSARGTIGAPGG